MMESNLVDLTASSTKELLQMVEVKTDEAAGKNSEPTSSTKETTKETNGEQAPIGSAKQPSGRVNGGKQYHPRNSHLSHKMMPPLPPPFYPSSTSAHSAPYFALNPAAADFIASPFVAAAAASQFFLPQSNPAPVAAVAAAAAAASSFFYTPGGFDPPAHGFKSHRGYVPAKHAQNLQKLWPHTVKKHSAGPKLHKNGASKPSEKVSPTNFPPENDPNQEPRTIDTNKTPLCLINELTKLNKIKHEFVLLDEIGPAHKKIFFVQLKLGTGSEAEETYNGRGPSIKKAQHSAAESALKKTKFKIPVPRSKKKNSGGVEGTVSINTELAKRLFNSANHKTTKPNPALAPTVLLNSLAMKLGLVANYQHTSTTSQPVETTKSITESSGTDAAKSSGQSQSDPVVAVVNGDSQDKTINPTDTPETNNPDPKPEEKPKTDSGEEIKKDSTTETEKPAPSYHPNWLKGASNPFKPSRSLLINTRFVNSRLNFKPNGTRIVDHHYDQQVYHVKLTFAGEEFAGEGPTLQMAKHNAATRALEHFSNTDNFLKAKSLAESTQNKTMQAYRPPQFTQGLSSNGKDAQKPEGVSSSKKAASPNQITILRKNRLSVADAASLSVPEPENNDPKHPEKSEINILHEFAFRLKKTVAFEVVNESGPPHAKTYRVKCSFGTKTQKEAASVGDEDPNAEKPAVETTPSSELSYFEVFGEGRSKKAANKEAAKSMIQIIQEKFEPLLSMAAASQAKKKRPTRPVSQADPDGVSRRRAQGNNIVKLKKASPEYGKGGINPIYRLIQIQQAKNEPEPVFELISSTNKPAKRNGNHSHHIEFLMQVTLKSGPNSEVLKCEGKGSTKKAAKQNAAELMLAKLGYQTRANIKPVLKSPTETTVENHQPTSEPEAEKHVKFSEDDLVVTLDPANEPGKKKTGSPAANSKLKSFKDQLQSASSSKPSYNSFLDKEGLESMYRIASEILESIQKRKKAGDSSKPEFESITAEQVLARIGDGLARSNSSDGEVVDEPDDKEAHDLKSNLQLLTGDDTNYKNALKYISNLLNFKVNYQSVKMRDGKVVTSINISVLPETDRALRGQGSSHVESSNAAALSALEYLASKLSSK